MSQISPRPIKGASSWQQVLGAVCIAQIAAIIGFDFTLPFIPLYLQHDMGIHGLGQTALWAGVIGFGPAIPATIFGPLWGRLADRFGYRAMLLRAMACAAVLLALMGLATSPWVLLGLRMIQGGLTGTIFAAQALVAATVPEKEIARSMGLLQMSVFVGATIGPVGGGVVAQAAGYRATFAAAGILLASAAVIVYMYVREPARTTVQRENPSVARPSMRAVLMIPAFAAALVLTLVVQLAATSLFPIIPLFVQELLHTTHGVSAQTGWLLAVSGIAGAAGSYLAGRVYRFFGLRRTIVMYVIVSSALVLPQAFAGSFMAFLFMRSSAAFAFGGLFTLVGALAATSSPADAKGTAFGLMGAASSLGFGAGPLLGGLLVAAFGIRPLFVVSAVIVALLPVILFLLTTGFPAIARGWRAIPPALSRLRTPAR